MYTIFNYAYWLSEQNAHNNLLKAYPKRVK
jgi:hypothetical protein